MSVIQTSVIQILFVLYLVFNKLVLMILQLSLFCISALFGKIATFKMTYLILLFKSRSKLYSNLPPPAPSNDNLFSAFDYTYALFVWNQSNEFIVSCKYNFLCFKIVFENMLNCFNNCSPGKQIPELFCKKNIY